jgi:hypothetical protein
MQGRQIVHETLQPRICPKYAGFFHGLEKRYQNAVQWQLILKKIFFWCDLPLLAVFIIFVFLPSSGTSYIHLDF